MNNDTMDQSPEDRLRKAEEERDRYKAALQRRTAELEVLTKELEALAYTVSHDLRAPLRHIDAFSTLLEREAGDALSKEAKSFLNIITQSVATMSKLLEHLLFYSRLSRAELLPQTVDMNAALDDVINKARLENPDRPVTWKKQKLPCLYADPAMMQQVLAHLISNALKFTRGRNPAELEIGYTENDQEVVVYVRDNGVGFDMRYAEKLFGVLQRMHRAEDYEGVGMGLASVRRIIARHGGRTWADAKVNGGATFYFSVPKRNAE